MEAGSTANKELQQSRWEIIIFIVHSIKVKALSKVKPDFQSRQVITVPRKLKEGRRISPRVASEGDTAAVERLIYLD